MNKKQLLRQYLLACYQDGLSSSAETKEKRYSSLAELGRYSKANIKKGKEQQLTLFTESSHEQY